MGPPSGRCCEYKCHPLVMEAINCKSAVLAPVSLVLNSHFTGSSSWAWVKEIEKRKKKKKANVPEIVLALIVVKNSIGDGITNVRAS